MIANNHTNLSLWVCNELGKIGVTRNGWDYESEMSHHDENGNKDAADIFRKAITTKRKIDNESVRFKGVARQHEAGRMAQGNT